MFRSLGRLAPLGLALASAGFLLVYAFAAWQRLPYPFALEWQEGSVLQQVERVRAGLPLYVAPGVDYVPLIYPPGFFWLAAAATALFGGELSTLRGVSLLASLASFAALFRLARFETGRSRYGWLAAGLFAATYPLSGAWLDVARVDSLALALLLGSAAALRTGRGLASALAAAALGAAGVWTKQGSALVVGSLALALLPFAGRRGRVFAAGLLLASAAPLPWLWPRAGSWLTFYLVELPASHPLEPGMWTGFWTGDLLAPLGGAVALAVFGLLGLRRESARDRAFWLAGTGSVLASAWLSRLHVGGFVNTLLPAHAWLALLAALGLARALEPGAPGATSGEAPPGALSPLAWALTLLLAAQLALLVYDPRPLVPDAADRAAGRALVERLAAIDGEIWVYSHGELARLAGKAPGAHRMAIQDVLRGERSERGRAAARALEGDIRRAVQERGFAAIVLDDTRSLGGLAPHYREGEELFDPVDPRFLPVSGLATRPRWLHLRRPRSRGQLEAVEVDRLRALGYLDFASEPGDPAKSGVVVHDPARSQPGYNLYSDRNEASATLMDARGRPLRSWSDPDGRHWSHAMLLADGDLLVPGSVAVPGSGGQVVEAYLMRLAFDGAARWRRNLPVHHDVAPLPGGELLALTLRYRLIPELHPRIEVQDNQLTLLGPDGAPREARSLHDVLRAGGFPFQPVAARDAGRRAKIDLLHANSVEWIQQPHLAERSPLYAEGNVLVCSRHQDAIFILDWRAGRLLWSWGPGRISGPHDARVLPNGHILLFDNGLSRGWSRVIELDPLRNEIVWQYRAPRRRDFFSASRGSSQRLPNGNTLIANSDSGHAFEVTREGEVVWEWFNPRTDARGRRATIVRMVRYEPAALAPFLAVP